MSSNKDPKFISKFKNQKLSSRITVTFSGLFLSITSVIFVLALVICIALLMNINKNQFEKYNQKIIHAITDNQDTILNIPQEDRATYIYETFISPISGERREISIQIIDTSHIISNDSLFEKKLVDLDEEAKIKSTIDELQVKTLKDDQNRYYFISYDLEIDSYSLQITTVQNINDYYTYTLILTIVIGTALLIVIISMLTLGKAATKKALAPLQGIADAVKDISEENLSIDIKSVENENEVDSLIIALKNMLMRLNIAFEEQNRFVSDVSHELRIPITIIQGYLDIIQTWGKNDQKMMDESLESIYTETSNMKELVEKLLLLQNLGSGNYHFEMEKLDVNPFLQKLTFETTLLTSEHKVSSKLSKDDIYIFADKNLLGQAVRSIIDNCIKYTNPGGEITISSWKERHKIYIQISDTGSGIAKEHLTKVKERFYRVDSARTKKTGGSGLGLSIVNAIITAMSGELIIKSELNKGSKFIIVFPRLY